jgi:hypothetical protein
MTARLQVSREQVLAYRRSATHLDRRLPAGGDSLRRAGWAGYQDSMPRAALLSIHARVEGATPSSWADPALVQTWGPRYSTYVIPREDVAVFTLGRLGGDPRAQRRANAIAAELTTGIGGRSGTRPVTDREVARDTDGNANRFRYAATTGTVLIRWEGARAPVVWNVPAPDVDPIDAQLELARRYLHVFGPTSPAAFATWAGISTQRGPAAFEALTGDVIAVTTPIGDAWILAADEPVLRAAAKPGRVAPARLLPSGDTFFLLWGRDRELLVEDPARRAELWTSRVWPGALVVGGEIAGTWRRANAKLDIEPWRRLTAAEREAVEAEATSLPLPGIDGGIRVAWRG